MASHSRLWKFIPLLVILAVFLLGCTVAYRMEMGFQGTSFSWGQWWAFTWNCKWWLIGGYLMFFLFKRQQFSRGVSALAVALITLNLIGCGLSPLLPKPGMTDTQDEPGGVIGLRDGVLDLATGGFAVRGDTDLSITTAAGEQTIDRVFNAATRTWQFNFEMTCRDGVFRDAIGTEYAIGTLPNGPIPGSGYIKASSSPCVIEGDGNIRFTFDTAGVLARIQRADHPWVETRKTANGRISQLVECTSASSCTMFYSMTYTTVAGQERLSQVADRTGRSVTYTYTTSGAVPGAIDVAKNALEVEQNLRGHDYDYVNLVNHPRGGVWQLDIRTSELRLASYVFDGKNRLISVTEVGEGNQVTTFEYRIRAYEALPYTTIMTDPAGGVTAYYFNRSGQITSRVSPMGKILSWTWTNGRPSALPNGAGIRTLLTWNTLDEIATSEIISAQGDHGKRLVYTYPVGKVGVNPTDPFSRVPETVSDQNGLILRNEFDAVGHIVSTKNALNEAVTATFGAQGVLLSVTGADGVTINYENYNALGLAERVSSGSSSDDRQFDNVGNKVVGADPLSTTGTERPGNVARVFNAARLVSVIEMSVDENGVNQDIAFAYESDYTLVATYRPMGANTRNIRDGLGRTKETRECVTVPAGSSSVGYNTDDGVACPVGQMSQSTTYEYNVQDQVTRMRRSNGMEQRYSYDLDGNMTTRENLKNGTLESWVTYTYDQYGRPLCSYDSTQNFRPACNTYDAFGRIASTTRPDGEKIELTYTIRDEVETKTYRSAQNQVMLRLQMRYDAVGREIEVRETVLNGYATNRVLLSKTYTQGRVATITEGNGLTRTIGYDELGRDVSVETTKPGPNGSTIVVETENLRYGSSNLFNPVKQYVRYTAQTPSGTKVTSEVYEGVLWDRGARYPTPAWSDSASAAFSDQDTFFPTREIRHILDLDLTHLAEEGALSGPSSVRVFNKNATGNRLVNIQVRSGYYNDPAPPPASTQYSYRWDSAGYMLSKNGVQNCWDATGHLSCVGADTRVNDAEGNLIRSTEAGVTTKVLWGGAGIANAAGVPQAINLGWMQVSLASPGTELYRHLDFRGNVKATWDQLGVNQAVMVYSAYRLERIERSDGTQIDAYEFAQGTRFNWFVIIGDRCYDPDSGQFCSPDPIEGIHSQFVYADGDTARYWDPTGREPQSQNSFGRDMYGAIGQAWGGVMTVVLGALGSMAISPFGGAAIAAGFGPVLTTAGKQVGYATYDARGWNLAPKSDLNPGGTGKPSTPSWAPVGPRNRPGGPRADGSPFSKRNKARDKGDANVVAGGGGGGGGGGGSGGVPSGGGCGLLGIEPLFVLLVPLLRKRARQRTVH